MNQATKPVNAVALVKGDERYVLLFDDAHATDVLRVLARWATNDDLSFTWYDAARLSQRVRQAARAGRET